MHRPQPVLLKLFAATLGLTQYLQWTTLLLSLNYYQSAYASAMGSTMTKFEVFFYMPIPLLAGNLFGGASLTRLNDVIQSRNQIVTVTVTVLLLQILIIFLSAFIQNMAVALSFTLILVILFINAFFSQVITGAAATVSKNISPQANKYYWVTSNLCAIILGILRIISVLVFLEETNANKQFPSFCLFQGMSCVIMLLAGLGLIFVVDEKYFSVRKTTDNWSNIQDLENDSVSQSGKRLADDGRMPLMQSEGETTSVLAGALLGGRIEQMQQQQQQQQLLQQQYQHPNYHHRFGMPDGSYASGVHNEAYEASGVRVANIATISAGGGGGGANAYAAQVVRRGGDLYRGAYNNNNNNNISNDDDDVKSGFSFTDCSMDMKERKVSTRRFNNTLVHKVSGADGSEQQRLRALQYIQTHSPIAAVQSSADLQTPLRKYSDTNSLRKGSGASYLPDSEARPYRGGGGGGIHLMAGISEESLSQIAAQNRPSTGAALAGDGTHQGAGEISSNDGIPSNEITPSRPHGYDDNGRAHGRFKTDQDRDSSASGALPLDRRSSQITYTETSDELSRRFGRHAGKRANVDGILDLTQTGNSNAFQESPERSMDPGLAGNVRAWRENNNNNDAAAMPVTGPNTNGTGNAFGADRRESRFDADSRIISPDQTMVVQQQQQQQQQHARYTLKMTIESAHDMDSMRMPYSEHAKRNQGSMYHSGEQSHHQQSQQQYQQRGLAAHLYAQRKHITRDDLLYAPRDEDENQLLASANTAHSNQEHGYFTIIIETTKSATPLLYLQLLVNVQTITVCPGLAVFLRAYREPWLQNWGYIVAIMIGTVSQHFGRLVAAHVQFVTNAQLVLQLALRFLFYPYFIIIGIDAAEITRADEKTPVYLEAWVTFVLVGVFMLTHGFFAAQVQCELPGRIADEKWRNYWGFVLLQVSNFGMTLGSVFAIAFISLPVPDLHQSALL